MTKSISIKVLLINPFLSVFFDDPAGISPPLGLAYLAAYLRSKGVLVKILDIAAEGKDKPKEIGQRLRYDLEEKEIIKRIKNYDPKIVGITCQSTLHAKDAHETAGIIKKVDKKILTVMGGAHPSALPEEVLKDENIDVVIRGEGEITLWDVVKSYSENGILSGIKGISFRMNNKVIHNSSRPLINNLDQLPLPAWDLLPREKYLEEIKKNTNYLMNNEVSWMISSRGCPGNCIYCAVRTVWGRSWRGRSPKNVVDEIETLVSKYGVREIHFLDDSMAVDRERLLNICEEIIKRKLHIKWTTPNGIAVWMMDRDLLLKMKKSGCYRLTFGLESGNKEILNDFVGKKYDFEKAKKIISFASSIGLWTVGTFIIGFPYETKEQIRDTVNFAVSTDLDFAVFYIANPFPGTPMYEIYKKEGLLPPSGLSEVVRGCRTKNFTHDELKLVQEQAFSKFLQSRIKRPSLFLNKIRSIEDFKYFLKLGKNFSKLMFGNSISTKGIAALWKR